MNKDDNKFKNVITLVDSVEELLRTRGLPPCADSTDLEGLITSVESLLETANELFDKIGE